jgi:inosose dehydratase
VPQQLTGALDLRGGYDPSGMRFGYAAITWGGNDLQAINDVGEVGFRGIQLRSPILKDFGDKPKALADLLKQHKLTFVALSGGGPRNDAYVPAEEITTQVKHATFIGGRRSVPPDDRSARPKDQPESKDFKALGRLLTAIGKRPLTLNSDGLPQSHAKPGSSR